MHRGAGCPADRPTESLDRRRVPSHGDRAPDGGDRLRFRVAKSQADVDLVLSLARELHRDSRFAEIPFSQDKCQRGLMRVIKTPPNLIVTAHAFCVSRRWPGPAPLRARRWAF